VENRDDANSFRHSRPLSLSLSCSHSGTDTTVSIGVKFGIDFTKAWSIHQTRATAQCNCLNTETAFSFEFVEVSVCDEPQHFAANPDSNPAQSGESGIFCLPALSTSSATESDKNI